MAVYTIHEPPRHAADPVPKPDRFVFVRDGFYFWAFLLPALWMLWHRMWLVLVIYAVIAAGTENAMYYAGAGTDAIVLVQLLISILIGVEAATLRRFGLARRGWRDIGIVSGGDVEDAERRFFDKWAIAESGGRMRPPSLSGSPPRLPPAVQSPEVIGLFPDPGASH